VNDDIGGVMPWRYDGSVAVTSVAASGGVALLFCWRGNALVIICRGWL